MRIFFQKLNVVLKMTEMRKYDKGKKAGVSWRCDKCFKTGNDNCYFKKKQSCQRHLRKLHKISDEVLISINTKLVKVDVITVS